MELPLTERKGHRRWGLLTMGLDGGEMMIDSLEIYKSPGHYEPA